jgi:hypothetical protein
MFFANVKKTICVLAKVLGANVTIKNCFVMQGATLDVVRGFVGILDFFVAHLTFVELLS